MSHPSDPCLESSPVFNHEAGLRSLEQEVLELHDQLQMRLLRYSVSLGLSQHDAEDVIQEVFLALFRHLRSGRSRANLAGWTFRVTHNLSLKRRIKREGKEYANDDLRMASLQSSSASPEEETIFNERHQTLRRTFEALPEVDRLCIQLRAEGLKYREIAEVLGISLGGVAKYLSRSFGRLRRSEGSGR
jgi:RNA polymerase sigma-70 factor (ECF subfamily)